MNDLYISIGWFIIAIIYAFVYFHKKTRKHIAFRWGEEANGPELSVLSHICIILFILFPGLGFLSQYLGFDDIFDISPFLVFFILFSLIGMSASYDCYFKKDNNK